MAMLSESLQREVEENRSRIRQKQRPQKMVLEGYDNFLGRGEGCFEIRKRENGKYITTEEYPLYQRNIIHEAILKMETLLVYQH